MRKLTFLCLLCAIVFVCASCASQEEREYKEGIALIRDGKYNEAKIKLSLPNFNNYGHAHVLYWYADAKTDEQKGYIAPAAETMMNVSDGYNGYFSEQVLGYKKEIVTKLYSLTKEQIKEQINSKQYDERQEKSKQYTPGRT